jgi:hydroxypyruvate reductase
MIQQKQLLTDIINHSMKTTHPTNCIQPYLPPAPVGHTYVIGAGKAAASMVQAFEKYYKGEYSGVAVTRYGFALPTENIELIEAAHPIPDSAGRQAAKRIRETAEKATEDDLVIFLLSGGASALLSDPADGINFENYQAITKALLHSGATIHEINTVRKHLTTLFGGKLLKYASPAKVVTLSISDVAGDDPATIGSGPTVSDPTTLSDTLAILDRYKIDLTDDIKGHLENTDNETLKESDPINELSEYHLIMTPQKMLEVTQNYLNERNISCTIVSDKLEGLTSDLAARHIKEIDTIRSNDTDKNRPHILLSSGEATVLINNPNGKGGSNAQFALDLALEIKKAQPALSYSAISYDTDGIDGNADHGGAYIDNTTLSRAAELSLDASEYSNNNNSYDFFEKLDDLIITGPTYTNVNDLRLIYFK